MRSPAFISNRRAIAAALLAVVPLTGLHAASLLETMDTEVSSLYEKSKDAIVKVHTEGVPLFCGMTFPPIHRCGTGFFIDGDGRCVTAATLVEAAQSCWVEFAGQRVNARILGTDPQTGLALLQIATGKPTPSLSLGNSDELRVGSMVVTIGFPYALPSAPVVGFVAGLDIKCGALVFPVSFIRAGCKLRPGQGGGPMFNARGEVVGIAVAAHAEDQCYALPINAVKKVCADIMQHGQPQHGWVGLSVTERQGQVFVQEVTSNSPAAAGGFRDHDVLMRICTNAIRRSADVLNTMFYQRCGDRINVTVLRDGQTQEVAVVVGRKSMQQPLTARGSRGATTVPTIVPVSAESPR